MYLRGDKIMDKNKHIVSISGGQDSTAMLIRMLELKMKIDHIVFVNPGYELPEMYEYIEKLDLYIQRKFGKCITTVEANTTIEKISKTRYTRGENKGKIRGLPYPVGMSYCTRELKIFPFKKFLKQKGILNKSTIAYLGYVYGEDRECGNNGYSCSYPLQDWGWTEVEVQSYLKEKSIYNLLYDNFSRTGCYLCPKQKIDSWYQIYKNYPELWKKAKRMEEEARKDNANIQTWRADGSLKSREKQFARKKANPSLDFNWNDSDISCFCR